MRALLALSFLLVIIIAFSVTVDAGDGQGELYVDEAGGVLSIGNSVIELRFDVSSGCYLSGFENKDTGQEYIAGHNDSYLYFQDGVFGPSSDVSYLGYTVETNTSEVLEVDVRYENTSRDVIFHRKIAIRPGEYFVEQMVGFENDGTGDVLFEQNTDHPSIYFCLPLDSGASVEYMSVSHPGTPNSYQFDSVSSGSTDGVLTRPVIVSVGYDSMSHGVSVFVPFFAGAGDCPHYPFECRLEDDNGYQSISISNYIDVIPDNASDMLWMSPIHFGIFNGEWETDVYSFLLGRETAQPPVRYNNYGAYVLKERSRTDEIVREDSDYIADLGVDMYHCGHGIWQADGTFVNASGWDINSTRSYLSGNGIDSMGGYVWEWRLDDSGTANYNADFHYHDKDGEPCMNIGEPQYLETMWDDYERILGAYQLKLIQFDMWRYSESRDSSPNGYEWSYAMAWRWHWSIWKLTHRMAEEYPDAWHSLDCSEDNQAIIDLNMMAKYPRFTCFMTNTYERYGDGAMDKNAQAALVSLEQAFGVIPVSRFSYPVFMSTVDEPCQFYGPISNIDLDRAVGLSVHPRFWGDLPNMTTGEKDAFERLTAMYHNLSVRGESINTISGDHYNITVYNASDESSYVICDMDYSPKSGTLYDYTSASSGDSEEEHEVFSFGVEAPLNYSMNGEDNTPPSADFSWTADGLTVTFTDNSSDTDGSISSYNWSFGDGEASADENPVHSYSSDGSYTVTLDVTDNDGAADNITKEVVVSEGGGDTTLDGGSLPWYYMAAAGGGLAILFPFAYIKFRGGKK